MTTEVLEPKVQETETDDVIVMSKIDQWWEDANPAQREVRKAIWKGIKQWFKDTSVEIRRLRELYKEVQRGNSKEYSAWSDLCSLRWEYRHRHIAWSLIKGRSMEQIERPGRYNKPSESKINGYVEEYEKTLCPDSE